MGAKSLRGPLFPVTPVFFQIPPSKLIRATTLSTDTPGPTARWNKSVRLKMLCKSADLKAQKRPSVTQCICPGV